MANVAYERTPEIRKKISEAIKASYIRNPNKKIEASRRRKGVKMNKDFGESISKALKGRKLSKEHIDNRTKSQKGLKRSKETLLKMKNSRSGEKCPFWKGGVSPINKLLRGSLEYRNWRESIYERDNYTCVQCGERGGKIDPDHIISFASIIEKVKFEQGVDRLYDKCINYPLLWDINNGRTLCRSCHKKTDTYGRPKNINKIIL